MASLRQLIAELTTEIIMLGEVIADLLAGDRGYQVIQQLPGISPVPAAMIIAEIAATAAGLRPVLDPPGHESRTSQLAGKQETPVTRALDSQNPLATTLGTAPLQG